MATSHTHYPPSPATAKNRRRVERALSGTVRAALLGVSDGLVTNLSLILGVAGAGADPSVVRLVGIASLIAGACSMAVGEYISMRGQVELLSSILNVEREELTSNPESTRTALEEVFMDDGVTHETAMKASTEVTRDPEKATALYLRGKLGLNTNELGNAANSAASSFVTFSAGAIVPLLPWFVVGGTVAIMWSIALAVIGALLIGGYLGYTTNGRIVRSAIRQLIAILLAAAITFTIGRLLHTTVG